MTSGLPDDTWIYVFRPPPAWPWYMEPDFDPSDRRMPVRERGFPSAAKAAFTFLHDLGFTLTAADAWDVSERAVTLGWERSDALVLATLADDGALFALIGPRADDAPNTPARERLSGFIGHRDEVAGFGSLPVLGRTRLEVAVTIAAYVAALRDRAEALLADRPIDFVKLRVASDQAIEDIRRPRLISYLTERAETAWNDARFESYLEMAEELEELGAPPGDPERIAIAQARRRPPLTLGDGDLGEADRIRRAAELVAAARSWLTEAVGERHKSREAWARWEDAARVWHEAMALLYPSAFRESLGRIRRGDRDAIERAITFLEVDPWVFRSGYAKETILRYMRRPNLGADEAARLRAIVLTAVDVGDRREFRGHCKLAPHVVDDDLRIALLQRLRSPDPGRARRALWVLDELREPLGPDDRAVAQRVLEHAASDAQWWRVAHWVRRFVGRYADGPWLDRLLTRALEGGRGGGVALRLLSGARTTPTADQRRTLARLVLLEIQRGDDESWLESAAVLADSPRFRDDLVDAYRAAADEDVRRRAWWAINAIRRSAADGWPGEILGG